MDTINTDEQSVVNRGNSSNHKVVYKLSIASLRNFHNKICM